MARKRGKELNTRLALLESAWQLFQQKGYEGTSVDAIVARAGLSKGTFFHYFPAKLNLLEAVCEHVVESTFSALSPQLEAPPLGARKRLNRLLAAMRTWRLAHEDRDQLLLRVHPEIGARIPGPHEFAR